MSENKNTLISLSQEISFLDALLETYQGETTPETEAKSRELAILLEKKTDGCAEYLDHEKNLIMLAEKRIGELKNFIASKENKIANFEKYIEMCLKIACRDSFRGDLREIKFRKPVQKLEIFDESKIPAEYIEIEQVTKIRNGEVKKALERGVKITGAKLVDGKKSLLVGYIKSKREVKNDNEE